MSAASQWLAIHYTTVGQCIQMTYPLNSKNPHPHNLLTPLVNFTVKTTLSGGRLSCGLERDLRQSAVAIAMKQWHDLNQNKNISQKPVLQDKSASEFTEFSMTLSIH